MGRGWGGSPRTAAAWLPARLATSLRSLCVHSPPFPRPLTPGPVTQGGAAQCRRARQVQPAGEVARSPNSRFSDYVTHAALRISVQSEAGVGRAWEGKLSFGLLGLLHPRTRPTTPPILIPSGAKKRLSHGAPKCVRLRIKGEGRVRTRAGCGPSHVLGGLGEGSCSLRLSASPLGAVAPTVPRLQLDDRAPPPAKEKKTTKNRRRVERCALKAGHHLLPPSSPPLAPPTRELNRLRSSWNAPQNQGSSDDYCVRSPGPSRHPAAVHLCTAQTRPFPVPGERFSPRARVKDHGVGPWDRGGSGEPPEPDPRVTAPTPPYIQASSPGPQPSLAGAHSVYCAMRRLCALSHGGGGSRTR